MKCGHGYISGISAVGDAPVKDFAAVLSDLNELSNRAGAINSRVNIVADRLLGAQICGTLSGVSDIHINDSQPLSTLSELRSAVVNLRAEFERAEAGLDRLQAAI